MTEPSGARGSLSRAAWSGLLFGAAVPALLFLYHVGFEFRVGGRSPERIAEETFRLGAATFATGTAEALAALMCSWIAGPSYSARWIAFVSVGAMYAGAFLGVGLGGWGDRPDWHILFSLIGGAVAGVLVVALLVVREKRGDREASSARRPGQ